MLIVDRTIYLSGMLGQRPPDWQVVSGGIEAETRQAMENMRDALADLIGGELLIVNDGKAVFHESFGHWVEDWAAHAPTGTLGEFRYRLRRPRNHTPGKGVTC